ncbi:MAG TPA: hypothetical protein VE646_01785 [Actinomycetota bacterium]|jgi:hypothetical protein|nr:hypothetical protein [Actinomycetota bacterium]
MNKRSAMIVAGGLVGAVASTAGAVSAGLASGPTAQAQTEPVRATKPVVKTIHRTITIHREPKHQAAPVRAIAVGPSAAASTAPLTHSSGSLAAGGFDDEHEGGGFEGGDD